jgi:hypothetical protein
MSGEVGRRAFLKSGAVIVGVTVTASFGFGGCANQYEIQADGRSTVFQLTNDQVLGGNSWVVYTTRGACGSYATDINGYNPSQDNPNSGWIFEVDGNMVDGRTIDPFRFTPEEGQIITWKVATTVV